MAGGSASKNFKLQIRSAEDRGVVEMRIPIEPLSKHIAVIIECLLPGREIRKMVSGLANLRATRAYH